MAKLNAVKRIGQGMFSTVYLKDEKTVVIESIDPVKEAMSFDWFPSSRLFPKVKYIDCDARNPEVRIYEVKYYPKVKSLKNELLPSEWEFYQVLRKIPVFTGDNDYDRYNYYYDRFSEIPSKFLCKRRAMVDALNAIANYGSDIGFEISPRNVATQAGRLILLDCFFMVSKIRKIRRERLENRTSRQW